jgi:drug/metabolite transporter (DMT)-like permease
MTVAALVLIVLSASLHVGWNYLSKTNRPSPVFFLLMATFTGLLMLPIILIDRTGLARLFREVWPLLVVTGLFEAVYYTGVSLTYRNHDMSLGYPLIRAMPVLIIPLASRVLNFGEPLSGPALLGMMLVFAGCIMIPLRSYRTWRFSDYVRKSMIWIVPAAIGTAGYTLVDGFAMTSVDATDFSVPVVLIYGGLLNLSIIPWMLIAVTVTRDWQSAAYYRGRKLLAPLVAGVGAGAAYLLVVAAMRHVTNVSYVAGFRQLSIPLGVLVGILILKEEVSLPRVVGTTILTAGLAAIALN